MIPLTMLAGAMMVGATAASAGTRCDADRHIVATLPTLRVASNVPVGTVLWSASDVPLTAKCGKTSLSERAPLVWFYRQTLDLGNGLSFYLTYNGNRGNAFESFNTGVEAPTYWVVGLKQTPVSTAVDIQLVKTGSTARSGSPFLLDTINVAAFGPSGGTTNVVPNAARFFIGGMTGVTLVPSTCAPRSTSIAVDLGRVSLNTVSGFGSAVGATSPGKDFDIVLNCDTTAAGTFDISMQLSGMPVAGYADQGVLSLSSGTATGLGIQVSRRSGSGSQTPVTFNKPWVIASYPLASSTVSVPLSARYYQTAVKVTPGAANGTATFTVTYQ